MPRRGSGRVIIPPRSHHEILEALDALIDSSARIPMSQKIVVSFHELQATLHELRESLPHEYQDAHDLLQNAENYALELRRRAEAERESARGEAARTLEDARHKAGALASDHEITRLAEERSAELVRHAEQYARQTREEPEAYAAEVRRSADEYAESGRRAADDYALRLLSHLQAVVNRAMASVEDGLQQIRR